MDTFSASDPFCVLFDVSKGQKVELGRTEVVVDSNNPKWIQAIDVDYHFEAKQDMLIEVYDADDPATVKDLSTQDYIGSMEFTLGQIVTSVSGEYIGELEGNKPKRDTRLKVMVEEKKANYGHKIASFGIEYNFN